MEDFCHEMQSFEKIVAILLVDILICTTHNFLRTFASLHNLLAHCCTNLQILKCHLCIKPFSFMLAKAVGKHGPYQHFVVRKHRLLSIFHGSTYFPQKFTGHHNRCYIISKKIYEIFFSTILLQICNNIGVLTQ